MHQQFKRLIDKETIKNEVLHDIKVNIDKIKKSDSININVKQQPNTNQKPINNINNTSKTPECYLSLSKYNSLTDKQKRRISKELD